MKHFVGVDLSLTGTGLIVLDEQAKIVEEKLIRTTPATSIEPRLLYILGEIDFIKNIINSAGVYMEDLSFGSRGQAMFQLAGLHYLVRTFFFRSKVGFNVVSPPALKKFVTGKGNAKKDLMLLKTYKKWGVEFSDDNLCDAYCLARKLLFDYEENTMKGVSGGASNSLQPSVKGGVSE